MAVKELNFRVDTKHRKDWFTGISWSHPAKMSLPLQLWLIDNFTKPGETVLDPLGGSGTILVACSMGRNVVYVELESKFCDLARGNWEKIKQRGPQMGYSMGTAQIIQGDARQLDTLLKGQADAIVTSPPYAEIANAKKNTGSNLSQTERLALQGKRSGETEEGMRYSLDATNIGNLSYKPIDVILTSPPYEASVSDDKEGPTAGGKEQTYGRWKDGTATKTSYTQHGEPSKPIDCILTSPPYEGSLETGSRHTKGGIADRDKKLVKEAR